MGNTRDAKQWTVRNANFAKTCPDMEALERLGDPVSIESALIWYKHDTCIRYTRKVYCTCIHNALPSRS